MVARLLWAKSPTAACGGCREGDFGAAVEMRRSEQRATHFGYRKRATKALKSNRNAFELFYTYRGVAQLVARLLWERVGQLQPRLCKSPEKPSTVRTFGT